MNNNYTFDQYQIDTQRTMVYPDVGHNIYYAGLGLGEAGEIQNQIKKIMRDDNGIITETRKAKIKDELGDLMWYISCVCHEMGLQMDDVAKQNIDKLDKRLKDGTIKGDGDR